MCACIYVHASCMHVRIHMRRRNGWMPPGHACACTCMCVYEDAQCPGLPPAQRSRRLNTPPHPLASA